jgi:hypothetical protein
MAVIAAGAVILYLRPVFGLGFYYDDWVLQAAFDDAPNRSWGGLFAACRDVEPAGRPGGCVYHTLAYSVLGARPAAYHVFSIILLAASTCLLFVLLRRSRVPPWPALLACVLYEVFPGSDATRLWPTAVGAQLIIGLYIGGVLLAIEALRRRSRWRWALHGTSVLLFVALAFTYEVVLPLIAVSGAFYLLAARDRRAALCRGAVDASLAAGFVAYRLFLAPVDPNSGFSVERTTDAWIERVRVLLKGGWHSWRTLFLPGDLAVAVVGACTLVVLAVLVLHRPARRPVLRWVAVATGSAIFAVVALLPYLPANDFYVPDPSSLFNRLNVAAAPAYCVVFVALAASLWNALRCRLPAAAATGVVGLLVAATAWHQIDFAITSQAAYAQSWKEQRAAVKGLERAAPHLPPDASVVSFGHPIWERGFIPVFSAGWDLRGAIDVRTHVDPPQALPFVSTAACGATSLLEAEARLIDYQGPSPLWFVNTSTAEVRRINSREACEKAVADWGRPPFWGTSIRWRP